MDTDKIWALVFIDNNACFGVWPRHDIYDIF